ncbi:DUF4335 domain-containing protein [Phormidesmis sp. 146-35]
MSSNSVLRKYTPPTCTLEISAKNSPLSRWAGRSVLKHLRFRLSFDDPRISEDQWMTVRGDRSQLESLCQTVTTYVQQFLNQSNTLLQDRHLAKRFGATLDGTVSPIAVVDSPSLPPSDLTADLSIQPRGILSHELFLGTLATEETGASIRLSAVQLADLATALDEYAADVTALPNLNRPNWLKNPPQWTSIAATFLIAVGLTTSALRLFDRPASQTAQAPTTSQGASSSDQRLALQPLPSASPSPLPLPTAPPPLLALPDSPASAGSQSATGDAKVTVPQTPKTPPKIKIVEPPEGSVAVSPILPQDAPANPSPDPIPPSQPRARVSSAPADAQSAQPQERAAASAAPSKDSTAFDTIPQVAEVRQYFKGRWNPPAGLPGDLQYRLVLNPDGSLQQNLPLNEAAGLFLDRPEVGMPLYNSPFVSPPKTSRSVVIRVVLGQDGSVQAFNESQ